MQYAADHDDGKGEKYYPKDLKQRAEVNKWLLWEASAWFASCYAYLVEYVVKPLLDSQPDQSIIDAQAPRWKQLAKILDDQLAKTKFLCGEGVTIADIAVASPMHLHEASKLPMAEYKNLSRWMKDIEALPCWQKTQPAVEKALLPEKYKRDHGEQTSLNYTKAPSDGSLTELYFYEDAEGKYKHIHEPGNDAEEMTFYDGWDRAKEFDLDKHGFSVKGFSPSYKGSWEDEQSVREKFYPEVVQFLKKEVGAKDVLVFDHTIRTRKNAAKKLTQETNTTQRTPVPLVHCDYTHESAPVRVRQLLPEEADKLLTRRVAFLNVWKPLAKVEEMPLAMCDVTTSPMDDFFKLYLRYRERTGENYVMKYSPDHKWWYFPEMTPDKVILLKTYDSETDGRARFVGHSAFVDPTSKPDAPFRESVEIRTIAFF
ncbi:hypothetical protein BAUCODRAFT_103498 [Baudoinia panamericana UAMH 10762]|uniref:GST C-terminal domain-containing protein n=1 Tax=Baudoinia panamericana (strain UAMH 10762) TaxID=717646 RepID=M2LW74_BAUPA|nr:uncharacterized protein BAUCODRAFT_103498 [Baudoinia panamericana UAMH 10762]EMC98917.1 hypothetical protein BAUCODRAFT_103498 [Baudoinia panamericana UAMH 10762]